MDDATALAIKKHLETIDKELASVRKIINEAGQKELVLDGGSDAPAKSRYLPRGWKRMTSKEKRTTRVDANSPMMVRIGSWFGRNAETLWTVQDAETLMAIAPKDKEVTGMEIYYTATIPDADNIRRRDMTTLINNWDSELDRARTYVKSIQ